MASEVKQQSNTAMRKLYYLWVPIILVALDQITKIWARASLCGHQPVQVIGEYVTFTYTENKGAAWGMLSGRINFFVIITALMIVAFLWIIAKTPSVGRYRPLLITLLSIVSGSLGNLWDRITRKAVTDFISFDVIDFPIFNVADICLTCGFVVLAILIIFYYKEEELSFIPLFKSGDKKKAEQ